MKTTLESGPQMALNDTTIQAAKHGEKPIKLSDALGLFLLLYLQAVSYGG